VCHLQFAWRTLVRVGSDHTDRRLEAVGVTLSKQICQKPVSTEVWPFEEVERNFERLVLRSWATIDGVRRRYQEGSAARMLHPSELIARYSAGTAFQSGEAMSCGTLPVVDAIRFATLFEIELYDPVLNRSPETCLFRRGARNRRLTCANNA